VRFSGGRFGFQRRLPDSPTFILRHHLGHVFLNREHVREFAVHRFGGDITTRGSVDDLNGDAQVIAGGLDRPPSITKAALGNGVAA